MVMDRRGASRPGGCSHSPEGQAGQGSPVAGGEELRVLGQPRQGPWWFWNWLDSAQIPK